MQQTPHQRKTLTERVIHAITFEGLATLILAPTAAQLMQRSVVEMGGLSILLATLAMVWNIIYNAAFDRLWPVSRFPPPAESTRPARARFRNRIRHHWRHHGGDRAGRLAAAGVYAEIGFMLFFLPYTMAFNWVWDTLRERVIRHAARARRRAVNPGADLRRSAATLSPKTIATDEP